MPPAITQEDGVRQEAGHPPDERRPRRYIVLRVVALAAYLLLFVLGADWWGLPLARDRIVPWVIGLLLIMSLPDIRSVGRGLVVDWLPFLVALSAYDVVRGHVDDGARAHVLPQLAIDESLPGDATPTVWLQQHFWHGVPSWYDYLAWAVYVTHFFVAMIVAAILWYRSRSLFRRWAAALLTLTALTLGTYALYPAVPPWMASRDGDMAPAARVVADVFKDMGWHKASAYLEVGANPVAALPSLHGAVPMLLLLFLWPRTRNRLLRGVLVGYTVGMALVLVYGAEHFTFDIALGWAYAVVATVAVDALARWRRSAALRDRPAGAEDASGTSRSGRDGAVPAAGPRHWPQVPYEDEPTLVPSQSSSRDPDGVA